MSSKVKREQIEQRRRGFHAAARNDAHRDDGEAAVEIPLVRQYETDPATLASSACQQAGVRLDIDGVTEKSEQNRLLDEAKSACRVCLQSTRTTCLGFALETDRLYLTDTLDTPSPDAVRGELDRGQRLNLLWRLNPELRERIDAETLATDTEML